jgi:L-ascorbate metabolism protein UlaG (beta-lactamase superfamily)
MGVFGGEHFDGRAFFNPTGGKGQPVWMVPRLLLARRTPWPDHLPVVKQQPPPPRDAREIVVTFIGHSTFLLQTSDGNILIDPVFSERASPVRFAGPRRVREPAVRMEDLPEIAAILISHNHYDHCDLTSLQALERRFHPRFLTPLGNAHLLESVGIRSVQELDWWQDVLLNPLRITLTPAQHFSARGPFDRNRALWGGFIIWVRGERLFFAGDSGYASHFREIRAAYGPMRVAMLPIGAYEPRWFMKDIHMNPAEALQAHLDLEASQSIAMHFGTFQLTPEGIDEPVKSLEEALRTKSVSPDQFRVLDFGESLRWDLRCRHSLNQH